MSCSVAVREDPGNQTIPPCRHMCHGALRLLHQTITLLQQVSVPYTIEADLRVPGCSASLFRFPPHHLTIVFVYVDGLVNQPLVSIPQKYVDCSFPVGFWPAQLNVANL